MMPDTISSLWLTALTPSDVVRDITKASKIFQNISNQVNAWDIVDSNKKHDSDSTFWMDHYEMDITIWHLSL